jgi:signal transduction histidine kinase
LSTLINKVNLFVDEWLISSHLKDSPIHLRKARVLVFLHLFLFFICLSFDISNNIIYPTVENPPLKTAMVITIGLSLVFKFFGNFNLSGNLLALFLFFVIAEAVPTSGGLFSDNLLWLVASPLLALLFANQISGLFWTLVLLGYTFYMYHVELNAPVTLRVQTYHLDAMYYLITYSGLFIIIVGVVLIFASGQTLIIKALNEKKAELEQQKKEITQQAQELKEAQTQLQISNNELEQFAYAASHDLKEPLRMIGSYTQLIKRKLSSSLDENTAEYMNYVTDGVSRMDKLLTDLLEYSRLGRSNAKAKDTDLNEILFVVINNLMTSMKDTKTEIFSNQLPTITATSTEMMQLFQNLIANSIKFRRKDEQPVIEITHLQKDNHHIFLFSDNGIGIPEESHQSVFNIFERLHSRSEYEGSGIGLATCKKIVKNLGGDIAVMPKNRPGTTIKFTIPCSN